MEYNPFKHKTFYLNAVVDIMKIGRIVNDVEKTVIDFKIYNGDDKMGDVLIFSILVIIFIIFIGSLVTVIFDKITKSKYEVFFILFINIVLLCLVTFKIPKYQTYSGISLLGIHGLQILILVSILCLPLKLFKDLI